MFENMIQMIRKHEDIKSQKRSQDEEVTSLKVISRKRFYSTYCTVGYIESNLKHIITPPLPCNNKQVDNYLFHHSNPEF
jgi:hypothetical protein